MCDFCIGVDFGAYSPEIEHATDGIRAFIYTSGGSYRFPKERQFKFCPVCGADLRDIKRETAEAATSNLLAEA